MRWAEVGRLSSRTRIEFEVANTGLNMMSGGDLYELAKILGHSNIKMTERYAKLGREHITKTSTTAKVIWSLMKKKPEQEEGEQQAVS